MFIHENASEYIVCGKAAILSRGRWVKCLTDVTAIAASILHFGRLHNKQPRVICDLIEA